MAQEMTPTRSDRYVNKSISEFRQANYSPIHGYKDQDIMTLENAVEKLVPFVNGIANYVYDAKQKCNRNSIILTWDESAAIYPYTMATPVFSCLNATLRAENRHELKPWFAFLKLFISALEKLPSLEDTVWRAVAGDVDSFSVEDNVQIWWSVNSSSTALNVVQLYIGDLGTLFAIDAIHGKEIFEYSAFPEEREVVLMPGTRVRLKSGPIKFMDLLVVHLEEEPTTEQIAHWLVNAKDAMKSN